MSSLSRETPATKAMPVVDVSATKRSLRYASARINATALARTRSIRWSMLAIMRLSSVRRKAAPTILLERACRRLREAVP